MFCGYTHKQEQPSFKEDNNILASNGLSKSLEFSASHINNKASPGILGDKAIWTNAKRNR